MRVHLLFFLFLSFFGLQAGDFRNQHSFVFFFFFFFGLQAGDDMTAILSWSL